MPTSVNVFIATLVIFTIALLIFVFHPHHTSQQQVIQPTQLTESGLEEQGIIYALVLDNKENPGVHPDHVVVGQDSMLIYIPKATQDQVAIDEKILSFNQLASLMAHDHDKNGYIDGHDPIFDQLHIAKLNINTRSVYYTPLSKAGVAAIVFNQEFITKEALDHPERFATIAGDIVMSDNSRWHLRVLPLHIRHFKQLTLVPQEQRDGRQALH